jgi:hypothetical protein
MSTSAPGTRCARCRPTAMRRVRTRFACVRGGFRS